MNALQQFHALHGATVSKQEIERIIDLAKQENNTEVIYRLSQVLQNFEQDKHPIEIVDYPTSLNAPRHTGSYKEALDNCGRLRPGYKFENGSVVKVVNKSVKHPTKRITKYSKKETILNSSHEVLNGIEFIENDTHLKGLNKAVSPNEIYDTVTNLIINTIKKVGHLPWQKEWIGSGSNMEAKNYVTKKSYSGINHLFLNFDVVPDPNNPGYSLLVPIKFIEPYYLTFNQIKEAKATLKKGSKAHQVFYYTMIYDFKKDNLIFKSSDVAKWKNFISENNLSSDDLKFYLSKIPVLKYYNVYRADDCTGLKFPAKPAPKTTTPIEQAQEIIDNYPNPPKYTFIGSDAYYTPATDTVNMPLISAFTKEAFYYSTYFHEIVHSTGHSKRLDRGNDTRKRDGSKEDKKAYAFEELVAELGAVFLCSESGILFTTVENSAKYLKGWNSRLVTELENDNRFFMKAAAKSQQAVDYILDKQNIEKNAQTPTKATDKIIKSTVKSKKTTKTVVENVPKVKEEIEYQFSKNDIPYELAYNAFSGTSFFPEKRAIEEQNSYYNFLKEVYDENLKKAIGTDKVELFKENFDKFKDGYLKRSLNLLHSRVGFFSTMIAGGSNFPVRRMEKKSNIINSKLNELIDFSKKGQNKLLQSITAETDKAIKTGTVGALEILQQKLKEAELIHKLNLDGNKVLRKFNANPNATVENLIDELIKVGFSPEMAKKEGEFMFNHKYMGFSLINSNAKIKRIKEQIALEEKLNTRKTTVGNKTYTFDGGTIVDNLELNKIQILFDQKPNETIRSFLKKAGQAFKWSPLNSAWQRQLNTYYKLNRQDLYTFLGVKNELTPPKQEIKKNDNSNIQLRLFGAKKIINCSCGWKWNLKDGGTDPYVCHKCGKDNAIKKPTKKQTKPLKGFDIVGNTIGNIIANSLLQPEAPKNSLASRLANKSNQPREYYNIPNKDIANFLGKIEKKTKESVAITIAGGQGSMKTRLCFQLMNCFAQNYKVGHASIEEHPESALYEDKIHQYLNKKALHNISAPEISTIQDVHNLVKENDVIVIDSFSKLQEMQKGCELDKDFRKAYDGKLFIIIYQQTTDGKMRGGSKSQFDGDVICFVKKEPNYQDNYCYMDKNRYQKKNLEDLKFNIYSGKLIGQEPETTELTSTPKLNQSNHQFNFQVV